MHARSSVPGRRWALDTGTQPAVDPVVLSATCQEFLGVRYYLCGFYFQRKSRRLHRAVWEHHHGPVPAGYHVHHVDEDRANNGPGNLALLPGSKHLSHHTIKREMWFGTKARAAAAEWHRSDEGRVWHREHAAATLSRLQAERF